MKFLSISDFCGYLIGLNNMFITIICLLSCIANLDLTSILVHYIFSTVLSVLLN